MLENRMKEYKLLAKVESANDFLSEFPDFVEIAREVYKDDLEDIKNQSDEKRDFEDYSVFDILNEEISVMDIDFIEEVLHSIPNRIFFVKYVDTIREDYFEIWEKVK